MFARRGRAASALAAVAVAFSLSACGGIGGASNEDQPTVVTGNPILFVTQVPVVDDFLTIGSTFGSQDPSPRAAARGGDLWIRYPDGTLRNLTAEAGFGNGPGFQGNGAIAVRDPCVHWSGTRAVFSMVVGSPPAPGAGSFRWQLYEVSGLAPGATAVITLVPNQPARNNIMPCYASDGRILFVSDRPRNGAAHLYPQLDEYEEAPTNTGIWSLAPSSGALFLMNHSPSGSFRPIVDSFGRVVFTRWDHLERDQQVDLQRMGEGNYDTYNWSDESASAFDTGVRIEFFPEPRRPWIDFINSTPSYSGPLGGWEPQLVGNSFNHFQLWTLNQDGTREETLNHIGRHELFDFIDKNRNDDIGVIDHVGFRPWTANRNPITAFHQVREDPLAPGSYYGIDCREFDTHASGQILRIEGHPSQNADQMGVTYVTHRDTADPTLNPSSNHSGFYRNPLPLSDGELIAAHTANTRKEENLGTPAAPRSRFDFRLKLLVPGSNGYLRAGPALTSGIRKRVQYYDPFDLVTYDGLLWELDPVEVRARPVPTSTREPVPAAPEQLALDQEGVTRAALRQYLIDNDLALIVSRDVTTRDRNDRQQPVNLHIPGGTQTLGGAGTIYDVAYLRIFQADQIRAIRNGVQGSASGRRVLATALHEPAADNPPAPAGPTGSVQLAPDGSMAALIPARRAVTWQLTDPAGAPVVNERYWVSFQPGEIRTCVSCHGLNTVDQAGDGEPTHVPQALRTLLQHLKAQGHL